MPAKPISFGKLHFSKRSEALAYLKAILYKYDLGDRVNAEDTKILMAALERHPEAKEKLGMGITHFSVRSAEYGTRCFWLNRPDGSTEKFSYLACISAKKAAE